MVLIKQSGYLKNLKCNFSYFLNNYTPQPLTPLPRIIMEQPSSLNLTDRYGRGARWTHGKKSRQ